MAPARSARGNWVGLSTTWRGFLINLTPPQPHRAVAGLRLWAVLHGVYTLSNQAKAEMHQEALQLPALDNRAADPDSRYDPQRERQRRHASAPTYSAHVEDPRSPDPAESVPAPPPEEPPLPPDVVLVQDAATLATCRAAVAASGEVDLDIETTGLSPYIAAILTIQLWCESDGRTYVIPPAR
jgi:hypothetical protein